MAYAFATPLALRPRLAVHSVASQSHSRKPPGARLPVVTSMSVPAARAAALQSGIQWVLEDYVSSGSNVAIGGGDMAAVEAIAHALSVKVETGALVDIGVMPVTPVARAAIAAHSLPTDLSVNHGSLDTFITISSQVDADLNTALTVSGVGEEGHAAAMGIRAERVASTTAKKSCVVTTEADFSSTSGGLMSIPILMEPIFAHRTAQQLRADEVLRDMGLRDLVDRADGSGIYDALLKPSSDITIDLSLADFQGVAAVGLLPTDANRIAVVSCSDSEAYDITSSLGGLADIANGIVCDEAGNVSTVSRNALLKLTQAERIDALRQLHPAWSISADGRDYLEREFRFGSVEQTHSFVKRAFRIAQMANSHPELTTTFNRVHVRLSTMESHGVTKLDVAIAVCSFAD